MHKKRLILYSVLALGLILVFHFVPLQSLSGLIEDSKNTNVIVNRVCIGTTVPFAERAPNSAVNYRILFGGLTSYREARNHLTPTDEVQDADGTCGGPDQLKLYLW